MKVTFDVLEGRTEGIKTPVGIIPDPKELNQDNSMNPDFVWRSLAVRKSQWVPECESIASHFETFGEHLPELANAEAMLNFLTEEDDDSDQ